MGVILYGGAFDPPHIGHVALAEAARDRFGVERLVVLVSERPGHRVACRGDRTGHRDHDHRGTGLER